MSAAEALDFVERHGIVLEAARHGAIPSLADAIAGETIRGSWWSHPKSRAIFAITRAVRASPHVLTCRLVGGKISFVHERLWPALARLAERFPRERLARVREIHSDSGAHRTEETPFPSWLGAPARADAQRLSETEASDVFGPLLPELDAKP